MEITLQELLQAVGNTNTQGNSLDNTFKGQYCIIRTYSAGVHCGTVEAHEGDKVLLSEARRIWSWEGAFTLNTIAGKGFSNAKMPMAVPKILLPWIEIIPVSGALAEKLKTWAVHND